MDKSPAESRIDPDVDPQTEERDDAIILTALRWSIVVAGATLAAGGAVAYWVTRPDLPPRHRAADLSPLETRDLPPVEIPRVPFTDVTRDAGITFVHENGAYGDKLLPETMGGGCAFFDYDADNDQDILFVNSARWPWDPRKPASPATMALYRNEGAGRFTEVTSECGLNVTFYGMGVAVGDVDNDGWIDVFISALGPNRLYRNMGNGKFVDVTQRAGVAGPDDAWSTSSGMFDYDNDGDLDLFVCNYLVWSREYDLAQNFQLTGGGRAYGRPQNFEGTFSQLYRNDGRGRFTDVSSEAGIQVRSPLTAVPMGKSLGVAFADLDEDGWLDIVVANDTVRNFLFRNQHDGTFAEVAVPSGVAFDMSGNARGAMGIDVARFRNNDDVGIAIGNFANEMTALYVSYGRAMQFVDEAVATGLGPNTRQALTFGVFYFDYDLDGRLDLFAANGHLEEEINRVQPSQHYEQPPQLFWNAGPAHGTEFMPVPAEKCGPDFRRPLVGRGAAYADIDGDGDLDVLITAAGRAPRLLRNDQQLAHHWIRFKLEGATCNRDAIGAWVEVHLHDQVVRQQVMPTRSYLSQVELPVTFGLGEFTSVESVVIRWPDGSRDRLTNVAIDRLHTIRQAPSKLRKSAAEG